jgi:hypothetical protein
MNYSTKRGLLFFFAGVGFANLFLYVAEVFFG